MPIPLHLFGGPLGVGKTTAIRRYVAESDEYVAVIVNDFGETGYDAALIAEKGTADRLRIENVPGGCLCCTSAAQLLPALQALCNDPHIKRIIIEPSGVALLDPLLKMLQAAAPDCGFELRSVIVLFDALKTRPAALELIPYWRHLAECADVAVINRCDLAPPTAADALSQWLGKLDPPKCRIVKTEFGYLPPEIFDLSRSPDRPLPEHHHSNLPPAGTFRSNETFRLSPLLDVLREMAPSTDRFKGVFNTDQGRVRLEIACGEVIQRPAPAVGSSSADWIGDAAEIENRLAACCIRG
jgi:G3E family GTPase